VRLGCWGVRVGFGFGLGVGFLEVKWYEVKC
jgi:hypothetical protein